MDINENVNKPTQGTWDNMTPSGERKPKVEFKIDNVVELTFADDFIEPREYPSQDGESVYYLFECLEGEEEKVFLTSAWSLLQGLKNLGSLAGKTVLVNKEMKDGKQHYSVEEVTEPEIPVEKPGETKVEEVKAE